MNRYYFEFLPAELNFIILSKLKYSNYILDEINFICEELRASVCGDKLWESLFYNEYPELYRYLHKLKLTDKMKEIYLNVIPELKIIEENDLYNLYKYLNKTKIFNGNDKYLFNKLEYHRRRNVSKIALNVFYKTMIKDAFPIFYDKIVNSKYFDDNLNNYWDELWKDDIAIFETYYKTTGRIRDLEINKHSILLAAELTIRTRKPLLGYHIFIDLDLADDELYPRGFEFILDLLDSLISNLKKDQIGGFFLIIMNKILDENKSLLKYLFDAVYRNQNLLRQYKELRSKLYIYFQNTLSNSNPFPEENNKGKYAFLFDA